MTNELRKPPPGANGSILVCKRCHFKNYDPAHSLGRCEWCGEDPRTDRPPLVLSVEAWCDDHGEFPNVIKIRPRVGVDRERYPVGCGLRAYDRPKHVVYRAGWERRVWRARRDHWVVVYDYLQRPIVCLDEAKFLEMFEPVDYEHFWREGEEPVPRRAMPKLKKLVTTWTAMCPVCGGEMRAGETHEHAEWYRKMVEEDEKTFGKPDTFFVNRTEAERLKKYADRLGGSFAVGVPELFPNELDNTVKALKAAGEVKYALTKCGVMYRRIQPIEPMERDAMMSWLKDIYDKQKPGACDEHGTEAVFREHGWTAVGEQEGENEK